MSFPFNYEGQQVALSVHPRHVPLISDIFNRINELGISAFIPVDESLNPNIEC